MIGYALLAVGASFALGAITSVLLGYGLNILVILSEALPWLSGIVFIWSLVYVIFLMPYDLEETKLGRAIVGGIKAGWRGIKFLSKWLFIVSSIVAVIWCLYYFILGAIEDWTLPLYSILLSLLIVGTICVVVRNRFREKPEKEAQGAN